MITSTQNLVFDNTQDINRTKKTSKRSTYNINKNNFSIKNKKHIYS